jgi:CubicO group peptidase (beta-lactamase class C family)
VPADRRAITVHQLLSHTSGLAADLPLENPSAEEYEEVSRDEALRRVFATPVEGPPGSGFLYSNPGYVLLAAVVERASGQPFRDFVRRELLEPAGMRRTGFWGEAIPGVGDDELARGYDEDGQIADLRTRSETTWFDQGGGEMLSTVEDLHRWADAPLSGRVLDAERVRRMWTPVQGGYALGWHVQTTAHGTRRIYHGGDHAGFGAELALYPDERGQDVLVLAWVQGRIQYRSVGDTLLAATPLRAAAPGSGAELAGWNMVSLRALRIRAHPANGPAESLEIESDGRVVRAERAPD